MDTFTVDHAAGRDAFLAQLTRFVDVVGVSSDLRLLAASRCHGWSRLEVAVHVRTGLQEMLGGVVATTDAPVDTDAASYWSAFTGTNDAEGGDVDAILWTRRTASAYRRPSGAMEHLRMVADGLRAAVGAMPPGRVAFQGRVLTSGDLLATWAVELAVHHLDLGDGVGPADRSALALARTTVERRLGARTPDGWPDEHVILLGAGRERPTAAELDSCPALAAGPALG